MDWKRIIKGIFLVLLILLLGIEVYMEAHFCVDEASITSTDTEKILRQAPEVVITEEDKALLSEILNLPSVQKLLETGESGSILASEDADVTAVAVKYLGEETAESLVVYIWAAVDGTVQYLTWKNEKGDFCIQATLEKNDLEYYKLYAPKREISYNNWDNERTQKVEVHRRWFAWLRDGMWKEGE